MPSEYTKVYISLPQTFLRQIDQLAHKEHQSRSALIREALKMYMGWLATPSAARFFPMTQKLRERFAHVPNAELETLIDRAVSKVRSSRGK